MFKSKTLIKQQQAIETLTRENANLKQRIGDLQQDSTQAEQVKDGEEAVHGHEKESAMPNDAKTAVEKRYQELRRLFERIKTAFPNRKVQETTAKDESSTVVKKEINHLLNQAEAFQKSAETVKKVSDELELLGVNAAIKAAKAQESGKSFLIVAEEIDKLSRHSRKSVEEALHQLQLFTEISRALTRDFSKTVESIENNMHAFQTLRERMEEQFRTHKKEDRETRDRM